MTASQSRRAPLRAMRRHEPGEAIAAQVEALRPFLGQNPAERRARLGRLLRSERRAARCGIGYDAARHAALRRLAAEIMPNAKKAAAPSATTFRKGNRED